jgi:ligand-binding sensor domain-containing protein/serine phosphatase RsbU (regulator of sigma subunit)
MKNLLILFCLLVALDSTNYLTAQTKVIISQLPDSLQPKVIEVNTRKAPRNIAVPTKPGGSYMGKYQGRLEKINLLPPPTHTFASGVAQGQAFFTTYTTDDGLAMDAISYGKGIICDGKGNIWFATQGGGVSKYDGKSFLTYTTEQGLANNSVLSIAEDKSGNLWFGTGEGLSRYDGKSFVTYTTEQGLADNTVLGIAEDKSGNLWFGTYGGVSKYDGNRTKTKCNSNSCSHNLGEIQDQKDHNIELAKSFITYTYKQGLANGPVLSIAEDKSGNLWFGTHGAGVSKYDGKSFMTYTTEQGLANNFVRSIVEDKSGSLWFGTVGGVSKYDGNLIKRKCNSNTCSHNLKEKQDQKGHNIELAKSFVTYTTEQGLANNTVLSIVEDKSGNLWFGTHGGGVSKYDGNRTKTKCNSNSCSHNLGEKQDQKKHKLELAKSFMTYTSEQGLANNHVSGIAEDKSGNLWFGTFGGGASKYEGKSFVTYTTEQGLANNSVLSIIKDKSGNLWLGTFGGGASKYDGKSITTYTSEQGLASNDVTSIAEDKSGNLWFGTYSGGVSKYDGKSFITYTTEQGLASNGASSIIEDKSGNLWFVTEGGLSKYDGKSFVTYTTEQGLAMNEVSSIAEDKSGNLWFGTHGGGVSKYDGKSFITYTTEQGLADNTVLSIAEDKSGNVWVGTEEGLSVVVSFGKAPDELRSGVISNSTSEIKIRNVTKQLKNLPNLFIGAIQIDHAGRMILGTNFGLYVLSANMVETIIKSNRAVEGVVYNQFTGYPVKDVNFGGNNNGAICLDDKGMLWVGHGTNGVTRVDLDAINKSSEAPNVVINKVSLKGEDVCYYSLVSSSTDEGGGSITKLDSTILSQQEIATYGKVLSQAERDTLKQRFSGITFDGITKFYPLPENLVLPFEQNALTFEFNAIETGRNFLVNYQYMLQGMDNTWSPITQKADATFNNLSEGDYTFLLKAESPWGVWSEPVRFSFKVLPPWYRTWWAYGAYALLLAFSVWLLVRLQTKRLKERQKELQNEVEIATVEIRSQKSKVESVLLEIEEVHKEITDSINYAERIQRSFLATKEMLDENLTDYFVFFRPKDVVSGDFYLAGKLDNGYFAIVNADSTGHGVPGAIMSILNITALEAAVNEGISNPAEIFNKARKTIIERLKKDGSEHGGKDGMDASIVCFNADKTQMTYTAAQNPIWVIRAGEVIQIKAEKMPIGKHYNDHVPFEGGAFDLQKGDQVYTLTDGFQDQFGGPKGKKFMIKSMREYVLSISHLTMKEQCQKLDEVFSDWKGDLEQVDDVCIIGVQV